MQKWQYLPIWHVRFVSVAAASSISFRRIKKDISQYVNNKIGTPTMYCTPLDILGKLGIMSIPHVFLKIAPQSPTNKRHTNHMDPNVLMYGTSLFRLF